MWVRHVLCSNCNARGCVCVCAIWLYRADVCLNCFCLGGDVVLMRSASIVWPDCPQSFSIFIVVPDDVWGQRTSGQNHTDLCVACAIGVAFIGAYRCV